MSLSRAFFAAGSAAVRLSDGAPAEAWAGFVLSGDGNWRLPPAEKSGRQATILAGAFLVLAALVLPWIHRRYRQSAAT